MIDDALKYLTKRSISNQKKGSKVQRSKVQRSAASLYYSYVINV